MQFLTLLLCWCLPLISGTKGTTTATDPARRRLEPVKLDGTRRDLVRSLSELNELAYSNSPKIAYDQYAPIYDSSMNLFKSYMADPRDSYDVGQKNFELEKSALVTRRQELAAANNVNDNLQYTFYPPTGENIGFGIAAAKYETETQRVIIFRGISSTADYHDMMLSGQGWFLEKLQPILMREWEALFGELPDDALARVASSDIPERLATLAGQWSIPASSPDFSQLHYNVDKESLMENGFWPLAKSLVRQWLPEGRDLNSEKTTFFTGHSQGGLYAQLVSMWLEKIDGKSYETVSFGAPGVQCAVRYAMNMDISADVDVTVIHSQITQYVHVLDPFGSIDFTAGKVCKFGSSEVVAENDVNGGDSAAKMFCSQIIGHAGVKYVNGLQKSEVANAYAQCLYYVNSIDAISYWLANDTILQVNGDTDGGCVDATLVPADPAGLCPACSSNRCTSKIPKPSFNWQVPSDNPCINSLQKARFEMVSFEQSSAWFANCMVLNDKSYALMSQNTQELFANGWSTVTAIPVSSTPSESCDLGWNSVITSARRGILNANFGAENTIGAALAAVDTQGKAISFDVTITKDGVPLVFADDNGSRLTGIDVRIRDTNFADLPTEYALSTNGITYAASADRRIATLELFLTEVCTEVPAAKLHYKVKQLNTETNIYAFLQTIFASPCTGARSVFEMATVKEAKIMRTVLSKRAPTAVHKVAISVDPQNTPGGVEMWLRSRVAPRIASSDMIILHHTIWSQHLDLIQEYVNDGYCVGVYGGNTATLQPFAASSSIDLVITDFPDTLEWTDPSLQNINYVSISHQLRYFSITLKYALLHLAANAKITFGLSPMDANGSMRALVFVSGFDSPLLDGILALGGKKCTPSFSGIELCLASMTAAAAAAGEPGNRRQLQTNEPVIGHLFLTLGLQGAEKAVAVKIAMFTSQTLIPMQEEIPSRQMMAQVVAMQRGAASAQQQQLEASAAEFAGASGEKVAPQYTPHPCRPGENQEPVRLGQVLTSSDGTSCIVLGEESSLKVSAILSPPPQPLASTDCYGDVKQFVLNAFGPEDNRDTLPDEVVMDDMLEMIFINCSKHSAQGACQGVVNENGQNLCTWDAGNGKCTTALKTQLLAEGLLTTDFVSFMNEIEVCAQRVASMTEFICEAMNDSSLWPTTIPGAERDEHVRRGMHYMLLLDKIILATKTGGNDFLINWLFGSLGPLLRDPDVAVQEMLNTFEMAKLVTIHVNVGSWNPPNACCVIPMNAMGFKTNVLEAVMEDFRLGFPANADAGMAFVLGPTMKVSTSAEHMEMYTSWNAAFCSHFQESPFFYAKLMAPQVLCSDPDLYVYHRMIGLYVHLWSVILSRRRLQMDPNAWTVIPIMDWNNAKMTQRWGEVNKVYADHWLQRSVLPDLYGAGITVRFDLLYTTPQGRPIHALIAASLQNDFDGLRITASQDAGAPQTLKIEETDENASPPCLTMVGGASVCFALGKGKRRLQGDDAPTHIINAYITKAGIRSPEVKVFEEYASHPCLKHAFGAEDNDEVFMMSSENNNCTVLGADSFASLKQSCNVDNTLCELTIDAVLQSVGSRRLAQSFADEAVDLSASVKVEAAQMRLRITTNGLTLYDVALTPGSAQCVGSPVTFQLCFARVPNEADASTQLVGASMSVLGVRRELIIGSFDTVSGEIRVADLTPSWLPSTLFQVDLVPEPFDPCFDVVCGPGEECHPGAADQDWCFPSLYEPYEGGDKLLHQLWKIAESPYIEFAVDAAYGSELQGWTLKFWECLAHSPSTTMFGWADRSDCMHVYTRVEENSSSNVPICVVAFEGVDEFTEVVEAAMTWRALHAGHWVWGGMKYEYDRFTRTSIWDQWIDMARDGTKCRQVYSVGHSFGSALSVLFELEYKLGRAVVFAIPSMFPYGFRPTIPVGDAFVQQGDPIQVIPPGWLAGGVRFHELCVNGQIELRGTKPSRKINDKDFCRAMELHGIMGYTNWLNQNLGPGTTIESIMGTCDPVDWITNCVAEKCADSTSPACAMGHQFLTSQMQIQQGQLAMFSRMGEMPQAGDWTHNMAGLGGCPIPANDDGAAAAQAPGSSTGCINLIDKAYLEFTTVPQLDENTVRTTMKLSPYGGDAQIIIQVSLLVDGSIELRINVVDLSLPVSVILRQNSYYCPQVLTYHPARVCFSYRSLSIALIVFLYDEAVFSTPIASVQLEPVPRLVIIDFVPSAQQALFSTPEKFFATYDGDSELSIPNVGFCKKTTSRCDANGACEAFRNAECIPSINICACGPNLCSDSSGTCVPADSPGALTAASHPCIGSDDAFTPFEFLPDPSHGDPFERCVIINQQSYLRLDYPTPAQAAEAVLMQAAVSFRLLLKLGFPVFPVSFERPIRVDFQLSPAFDTVKVSLFDEGSTPALELISKVFPLFSTEAEFLCASFATGQFSVTLADVCLFLSASTLKTQRRRRLSSDDPPGSGNGHLNGGEGAAPLRALAEGNEEQQYYEREVDSTVYMPAINQKEKERIAIATVASDGEVTSRIPDKYSKLEKETNEQNAIDFKLTPSIIVIIVALILLLISAIAGYVCHEFRIFDDATTSSQEGGPTEGKGIRWSLTRGFLRRPSREKGELSAVQFARAHEANVSDKQLQRPFFSELSSILFITNRRCRLFFSESLPAHFVRVWFMNKNVNNIIIFSDEREVTRNTTSGTIRRFMCWRRSIMMLFCFLASLIFFMGIAQEIPRLVRSYSSEGGLGSGEMTVEEVERTMKLMNSFGGGLRRLEQRREVLTDEEQEAEEEELRMRASELQAMKMNPRIFLDEAYENNPRIFLDEASQVSVTTSFQTSSSSSSVLARMLQDSGEGNDDDEGNILLKDLGDATNDVERGRQVLALLQNYATVMYTCKVFITLFSMITVACALRRWGDYVRSSSWTMLTLAMRIVVNVVLSWIPWYAIFFRNPDFPEYMTRSAKIYVSFLVNLPLFSLSFMVTPALVNASMIVIYLMPYTILPYLVVFVGPILSVIALWPMLSVIGHGSVNWLILYGSLIYVSYACVTSLVAFRSLKSMEALENLGFTTKKNAEALREGGGSPILDPTAPRSETKESSCSDGSGFTDINSKTEEEKEKKEEKEWKIEELGNSPKTRKSLGNQDLQQQHVDAQSNMINHNQIKAYEGKRGSGGDVVSDFTYIGDVVSESVATISHVHLSEQMDTSKSTRSHSPCPNTPEPHESGDSSTPGSSDKAPNNNTNCLPDNTNNTAVGNENNSRSNIVENKENPTKLVLGRCCVNPNIEQHVEEFWKAQGSTDEEIESEDSAFLRRISMLDDFALYANRTLCQDSCLKVFPDPKVMLSPTNGGESNGATGSTRRSIMKAEAFVQGTLLASLREKMQPRMYRGFSFAKVLYFMGIILMLTAIIQESMDMFEVMINGGSIWSYLVSSLTECVVNNLLIQLIFVDFLIVGLIKLRLFNGYMRDDDTLSSFIALYGLSEKLSAKFDAGVQRASQKMKLEDLTSEKVVTVKSSKYSEDFERKADRSRSLPVIAAGIANSVKKVSVTLSIKKKLSVDQNKDIDPRDVGIVPKTPANSTRNFAEKGDDI